MKNDESVVFVIDDDASIRRSLERLLKSVGLAVKCFESAGEFLNSAHDAGAGCIVLDVRMPGLSGFDLQDRLTALHQSIPIIFLTGHGSIPQSVRAMKAGAVDFIEKPFDNGVLIDAVNRALVTARDDKRKTDEINDIRTRFHSLTPRERQVLTQVVQGKINKQIAFDLGTVEKTIKVHRAHVMRKMKADSVAALVRMAEKAGIVAE
ncbi:MAG: response regulator transcription factor [Syntrophobacter sp.]